MNDLKRTKGSEESLKQVLVSPSRKIKPYQPFSVSSSNLKSSKASLTNIDCRSLAKRRKSSMSLARTSILVHRTLSPEKVLQ